MDEYMDEYIANIIEERKRMRDCSGYGLYPINRAAREELDRRIAERQKMRVNRAYGITETEARYTLEALSRRICDEFEEYKRKVTSEEKHMDTPTIIDLIGKYMRKAHCKKGEAIKRIGKVFNYAEHDIAKDIARTKDDSLPTDHLADYWLDFYYDLDKMSVEKAEKRVLIARFNQRFTRISTNRYRIKDVIFNNPATIIFWEDGTKTVAKCKEGETYSPEIGIMVCYFKRIMNNVIHYDGKKTMYFSCMNESPNKALSLLSEIATYNTKGDK